MNRAWSPRLLLTLSFLLTLKAAALLVHNQDSNLWRRSVSMGKVRLPSMCVHCGTRRILSIPLVKMRGTSDNGIASLRDDEQKETFEGPENGGAGGGSDTRDASDMKVEGALTESLVAMVQFYKKAISPLLAPACRFYPTCSSYAIQSLKDYGPARGIVLTAWRILRCNPSGGKGYDTPQWPPPGYFAGGPFPPPPPPDQ
mmetsp:Transcript_59003/g.80571  ORF Transcript_59003/g.80571 Transcript_59003/m.80571 type:complete len:200 (-) Transcript_59003:144-743(-)